MTPPNATGGASLGGRYTLTDRIAVGGMGEVWAATDTILGRTVAVKLLHQALSQESDFVERFRAEARHTASLHHPNIATVFDFGEDDGTAYLVMELVAGQPLSQIIAERAPLSAQETVSILAQAATALEAAHQGGVVHRDVKPANILITPEGTAKLTDFGISRATASAPLTQTGQVLGTAQYLSPEQALGQSATASSDVYSLGVVGYEMLTGKRPFEADTVVATALAHVNQPPPELPDSIPTGIRDVVNAALAKNPADRPASAAAMASALRMPDAFPSPDAASEQAAHLPATGAVTAPPPAQGAEPTQAMPAQEPEPTQAMPAQGPEPTQAMPAQGPEPTQAMPALTHVVGGPTMPTQPTGIPAPDPRGARRRPAWLVPVLAVAAVIAVMSAFALAGSDAGTKAPATSTSTSAKPVPTTRATSSAVVAPPATSSAPSEPSPGKGSGKRKGKP